MRCSHCQNPLICFSVPTSFADQFAEAVETSPTDSAAAICSHCLSLTAIDQKSVTDPTPDFSIISPAFPTDPDIAIPFALAIGCCRSLATNRATIIELFETIEQSGTDPLLILDRLLREPSIEPAIDLDRRQHQLEQLMSDY